MTNKFLIHTNLWVYLYGKDPLNKSLKVRELINKNFESIIITTQVLGELFNVLTRKKIVGVEEATQIISELASIFLIIPIETPQVLQALEIYSRYKYSYWDRLIIATALLIDCQIIYSEDMQHEQVIDNNVTIINPFIEEIQTFGKLFIENFL